MAANGVRSVVVAGPDLPKAYARRLGGIASRPPGTEWIDFAPWMICRIRQGDLLVNMGGYRAFSDIV